MTTRDPNEMKPFWMLYGVSSAGRKPNIRQNVSVLLEA